MSASISTASRRCASVDRRLRTVCQCVASRARARGVSHTHRRRHTRTHTHTLSLSQRFNQCCMASPQRSLTRALSTRALSLSTACAPHDPSQMHLFICSHVSATTLFMAFPRTPSLEVVPSSPHVTPLQACTNVSSHAPFSTSVCMCLSLHMPFLARPRAMPPLLLQATQGLDDGLDDAEEERRHPKLLARLIPIQGECG